MKKIEFTQEQKEYIKKLYTEENKSLKAIGEIMGVSRKVITRVLQEEEQTLRERTGKYKAEYNIFENINTPEKAYWLGFIAADGCVYERENNASLIINIHDKDKDHLEKFKNFICTDAKIVSHIQNGGFSNNTPMVKITLNSKKMVNDLKDKGIVPRKSLILDIPNIESEYFLPYILGYFDGDGSVNILQNGEFSISIQGTKETLDWINSLLNISTHLEKRKDDDKNSYYIRCGGTNKPYSILKQLYDSCEVHLERKYQNFKELEKVVLNRNVKNY